MEKKGLQIFNRFKQLGDQQTFTLFFDYYYHRLFEFATILIRIPQLAEEVVLTVFMTLWNQRHNLSSIQNIEVYLFVSVRNGAMNMLRKEMKFTPEVLNDAHVHITDYQPNAENELIEREMVDILNQAVAQLPPQCKVIFKLIREDGLSRSEVAQILNISPKTVDSQIALAVKKIAHQLNIDLTNPSHSKLLISFLFL